MNRKDRHTLMDDFYCSITGTSSQRENAQGCQLHQQQHHLLRSVQWPESPGFETTYCSTAGQLFEKIRTQGIEPSPSPSGKTRGKTTGGEGEVETSSILPTAPTHFTYCHDVLCRILTFTTYADLTCGGDAQGGLSRVCKKWHAASWDGPCLEKRELGFVALSLHRWLVANNLLPAGICSMLSGPDQHPHQTDWLHEDMRPPSHHRTAVVDEKGEHQKDTNDNTPTKMIPLIHGTLPENIASIAEHGLLGAGCPYLPSEGGGGRGGAEGGKGRVFHFVEDSTHNVPHRLLERESPSNAHYKISTLNKVMRRISSSSVTGASASTVIAEAKQELKEYYHKRTDEKRKTLPGYLDEVVDKDEDEKAPRTSLPTPTVFSPVHGTDTPSCGLQYTLEPDGYLHTSTGSTLLFCVGAAPDPSQDFVQQVDLGEYSGDMYQQLNEHLPVKTAVVEIDEKSFGHSVCRVTGEELYNDKIGKTVAYFDPCLIRATLAVKVVPMPLAIERKAPSDPNQHSFDDEKRVFKLSEVCPRIYKLPVPKMCKNLDQLQALNPKNDVLIKQGKKVAGWDVLEFEGYRSANTWEEDGMSWCQGRDCRTWDSFLY